MSKAEELYKVFFTIGNAEETMFEALLTACGIDPSNPDPWPMEDWSYDYYDNSFEFYGCRDDWAPTNEQLQACFTLGFSRCWINYRNGTERSAGFGNGKYWPLGEPKLKSFIRGNNERHIPVARLIRLQQSVASAKDALQEWTEKQGQDRCWYYPEIFDRLCEILGVGTPERALPSRTEFEAGCKRFTDEEF